MKYDIFISYRRKGGSEKAELLRTELISRGFSQERIFMDTYSLKSGAFMDNILKALKESETVIVVISEGCFDSGCENGHWIQEISYAMKMGKRIIPVYFDGITEIDPETLPASIREFPKENAIIYVHSYAKASFDNLNSLLPSRGRRFPLWAKMTGVAAALALTAGTTIAMIPSHNDQKEQKVYVVDSSTSECYHTDKDCRGLRKATHKLKSVTLEQALKMGKRPCKICTHEK